MHLELGWYAMGRLDGASIILYRTKANEIGNNSQARLMTYIILPHQLYYRWMDVVHNYIGYYIQWTWAIKHKIFRTLECQEFL